MLNGGYTGNILRVDLCNRDIRVDPLEENLARQFLGGRRLDTYILHREMETGVDPFSPESKICFLTGPFHGTATPYAPKFLIVNKSPLSGSPSRSVCGGGGFLVLS